MKKRFSRRSVVFSSRVCMSYVVYMSLSYSTSPPARCSLTSVSLEPSLVVQRNATQPLLAVAACRHRDPFFPCLRGPFGTKHCAPHPSETDAVVGGRRCRLRCPCDRGRGVSAGPPVGQASAFPGGSCCQGAPQRGWARRGRARRRRASRGCPPVWQLGECEGEGGGDVYGVDGVCSGASTPPRGRRARSPPCGGGDPAGDEGGGRRVPWCTAGTHPVARLGGHLRDTPPPLGADAASWA